MSKKITLDLGTTRENLAALQVKRSLKTSQLADAAGLHPGSLSRFLAGGNSMPLDRLEKMLDALGARLAIVWDEETEG